MRRIPPLVLALVLVAAGLAACGGYGDGEEGEAGDFMVQVFTDKLEGNYARYWETLHPAQQATVAQDQLAECLSAADQPELVEARALDAYDDDLDLEGIPQREAQVVTLRLETRQNGQESRQTVDAYAVDVDGSLRWVMSPGELETFRAGDCP